LKGGRVSDIAASRNAWYVPRAPEGEERLGGCIFPHYEKGKARVRGEGGSPINKSVLGVMKR